MFSEEQGEVEAEWDDETNVEENYDQNVPSPAHLLSLITGLAASEQNSPTNTNTVLAQHYLKTKHV